MKEIIETKLKDSESLEYQQANDWWRTLSQMRRRDIALFTALEGAVLTIIGKNLLKLTADGFALSFIAFFIAIIGFNNERRLYLYLYKFRERAIKIEQNNNMSLLSDTTEAARSLRFSLGSTFAFRSYYAIIAIGWIFLWIVNL